MKLINATLRKRSGLFSIALDGATIASVTPQPARIDAQGAPGADEIDVGGKLVIPPLVEPHIHLDAVLTAGEPEWNMSGTLFEGIERWAQRKATITHEDTKARAHAAIGCCAITAFSTCAPTST